MNDAIDDRAEAAARPAARWPAEDGSSYAVPRGRPRARWLLPTIAVVVGLLLGAAAVVLISLH